MTVAITCWAGKCKNISGAKLPKVDPYQLHAAACDCPCHDNFKFVMGEREMAKLRR